MDKRAENRKAVWQFVIALAIILGGVAVGTLLIIPRADRPRKSRGVAEAPARESSRAPTFAVPANVVVEDGMVWIPPGTFPMGSESGQTDERPVHDVTLDGFWIDRFEMTNEEFAKFIEATHYVTTAERKPDPKDFPGVPPEKLA